jgi:TetR/AcrR family transcriptional repressor of nem operon
MSNRRSPSLSSRRRNKTRSYESGLRSRAKEETRDALVRSALALFAEKGLDAPSIDEICIRAGYSRGAFYAHFGDRDALVLEAMRSRRRATFDGFLKVLGDEVSVLSLLELLGNLVASGSFPPTEDRVRSSEFLQACRRSKDLRRAQLDLLDETTQRLASIVRRDQVSGVVRRDVDPVALGALLVLLEAGVEMMADLGWSYDVRTVARLMSHVVAPSGIEV